MKINLRETLKYLGRLTLMKASEVIFLKVIYWSIEGSKNLQLQKSDCQSDLEKNHVKFLWENLFYWNFSDLRCQKFLNRLHLALWAKSINFRPKIFCLKMGSDRCFLLKSSSFLVTYWNQKTLRNVKIFSVFAKMWFVLHVSQFNFKIFEKLWQKPIFKQKIFVVVRLILSHTPIQKIWIRYNYFQKTAKKNTTLHCGPIF
jgi:hypothetical protein